MTNCLRISKGRLRVTDKECLKQIGFHTEHPKELATFILARMVYAGSYLKVTRVCSGSEDEKKFNIMKELFCRWYLGDRLENLLREYAGFFENLEKEIRHDLRNARISIFCARQAKMSFEFNLLSCIELLFQCDIRCNPAKENIFDKTRQKAMQFIATNLPAN